MSVELSIVSPVYKSEKIVDELVRQIAAAAEEVTPNYEIILVEDGSPDNSWERIASNCKSNPKVKGVKLSRNFGQHYAITAALEASSGNWVVLMDCDLQDNPKYIKDLYQKGNEGYDVVFTKKDKREHGFLKNMIAGFYFSIFNFLSESVQADNQTGAYSILNRKAVNAFCKVKEHHRHYLNILRILGFKSTSIEIVHEKRFEGNTSYSTLKLINLAFDGLVSESDKLLKMSIRIGFMMVILSFVWTGYLLYSYFMIGSLPGFTSLMMGMLLSTGMILMSIGISGLYIGKIFEQVKNRPLYFIDEQLNFEGNDE